MMNPRYREIKSEQVPGLSLANGIDLRVLCGKVEGTEGPVRDIAADPGYLDVTVPAGTEFEHPVKEGYRVFAYVMNGTGYFATGQEGAVNEDHLVIFQNEGNKIRIKSGDKEESLRFLLVSGKPIGEPVAWHGPIVMNTQQQLETAFQEYQQGTFIKHKT
jgi:redox-sensitive bicupin YhaK (pirin superfamily)